MLRAAHSRRDLNGGRHSRQASRDRGAGKDNGASASGNGNDRSLESSGSSASLRDAQTGASSSTDNAGGNAGDGSHHAHHRSEYRAEYDAKKRSTLIDNRNQVHADMVRRIARKRGINEEQVEREMARSHGHDDFDTRRSSPSSDDEAGGNGNGSSRDRGDRDRERDRGGRGDREGDKRGMNDSRDVEVDEENAAIARQKTRYIKKEPEQMARITHAIKSSISFKDLDSEQLRIVVDAMEMKKYAKGEVIITQGALRCVGFSRMVR